MSAAIATLPAHPLLSASLVAQMGGAGDTLQATIERSGSAVLLYAGGEVDAANESIWRRLLGEAAAATAAPGPLLIDTNGLDFMAGCAYAAGLGRAGRPMPYPRDPSLPRERSTDRGARRGRYETGQAGAALSQRGRRADGDHHAGLARGGMLRLSLAKIRTESRTSRYLPTPIQNGPR
jgi:hypothetical protein